MEGNRKAIPNILIRLWKFTEDMAPTDRNNGTTTYGVMLKGYVSLLN